MAEHSEQEALLDVMRNHHWPRVAAAHHTCGRIQLQRCLDVVRIFGVAFITTLGQHGLDLLVEQRHSRRGFCLGLGLPAQRDRCGQEDRKIAHVATERRISCLPFAATHFRFRT